MRGIKRNDMLNQSTGLLLMRLSFPAMTGMLLFSLLCLVETFFVSRLGTIALAAMTLTIPAQVLITALASAVGTGLTSFIARSLGQGRGQEAANAAWHGLLLAIVMGILTWALGVAYLDGMLVFSGCTPETFALSHDYLTIILSGSVFIFLAIMLGNVIQGEGDTIWPMLIALAGLGLNVLLDPL